LSARRRLANFCTGVNYTTEKKYISQKVIGRKFEDASILQFTHFNFLFAPYILKNKPTLTQKRPVADPPAAGAPAT